MATSDKHSHGWKSCSSHRTVHWKHFHTGINNSLATWPLTFHCLQGVCVMIKGISLFITHSTSSLTTSCQTWMESPAVTARVNSRLCEWLTVSVEVVNRDWCCGHFLRLRLVCCVFWGFLQKMPLRKLIVKVFRGVLCRRPYKWIERCYWFSHKSCGDKHVWAIMWEVRAMCTGVLQCALCSFLLSLPLSECPLSLTLLY